MNHKVNFMKKILALAWILALCLGLLLYSLSTAPDMFPMQPTEINSATGDTPSMPAEEAVATASVPEETVTEPEETTTVPEATTMEPTETTAAVHSPVLFLNGHPVLQLIYEQLCGEFYEQSGIQVVTVSPEANLQGQAPVLFSTVDENTAWSCLDLADTVARANLACNCFTLTAEEQIVGIASEAEPFGLIYNTALLARVGYTGGDLDSLADIKNVAAYITQNQEELEFGAFAQPDEAGRFASVLAALPGDIRSFWDVYAANPAPGTVKEGKAVFCLGTLTDLEWLAAGGERQLDMLPLYMGDENEANQGLHCYGKNYWSIRADAAPEEINDALAFLNFLVSPRTDGTVPVDDLKLLAPYRQAVFAHNSVEQRFRSDIATGKSITVCGSEEPAPEGFAQALLTYAADPTDENWTAVEAIN